MSNEIKVGQEVVILHIGGGFHYSPSYYFGWKVVKVTPAGQVVVGREGSENRRFARRKHGDRGLEEVGGSSYSRDRLELDVAKCVGVVAREKLRVAAANALNKVRLERRVEAGWSTLNLQQALAELETLVADAKAKVEAVPDETP